ncbi:MAG: SdrD B-like domain-containing protein [Caldilineaceae bacterium]
MNSRNMRRVARTLAAMTFSAMVLGGSLLLPDPAAAQSADGMMHLPNGRINASWAQKGQSHAAIPPGQGVQIAGAGNGPDVVGQWSAVYDWPVMPIHATLLPNGKVLAWDATPDDFDPNGGIPPNPHAPTASNTTRATVWDPVTNAHLSVNPDTQSDIFCAGHAFLPDGRLFIASGDVGALGRFEGTNIFDPADNSWTRVQDLYAARWYPSAVPLANGEIVVVGGGPDTVELWTKENNYRVLTGATRTGEIYPWMHAAPNGKVFYSGPFETLYRLDTTGDGAWQQLAQRDTVARDYGSVAAFDVGKVLVTGGGPSADSALVLDMDSGAVTPTGSMHHGRRQHNITILADGTVLATGGNDSGVNLIDIDHGVYAAELWDPATGEWTVLATMQRNRQYHSTALLLPDGRVLSGGGGYCTDCTAANYHEPNVEIFSPPYLFKKDGSGQLADRPIISSIPDSARYSTTFDVTATPAAAITKVALVRLSSVTHSVNLEQRYLTLNFSQSGSTLSVTAPANPNLAPPGYSMLFLINADGVPSVAEFIRLEADAPIPTPTPYVGPSKVRGRVWLDQNGDGIQDAGEVGIANVQVQLFDSSGANISSADTDADGQYLFDNVPAGNHVARVNTGTLPNDAVQTYDPDGILNNKTPINLAANQILTDVDFGYLATITATPTPTNAATPTPTHTPLPNSTPTATSTSVPGSTPTATNTPPPTGTPTGASDSVAGRVWRDENGDGAQDVGEAGIAGVSVVLFANNGARLGQTTTKANGSYLFPAAPTGNHVVRINPGTLPVRLIPSYDVDGILNNKTSISKSVGASLTAIDFGYQPLTNSAAVPAAPVCLTDGSCHDASDDVIEFPAWMVVQTRIFAPIVAR